MCRRQPGREWPSHKTQYLHDTALQQQHSWHEVTKNIPLSAEALFTVFLLPNFPQFHPFSCSFVEEFLNFCRIKIVNLNLPRIFKAETSLTADGGHSRRLFNKYMSLSCCTIHVHAPAGRCRVPVFKTCCIQCSKFVFYSIFFYGQANILILCF